jgi:pSer/pThr/pTyr-binding forkhead associated (FHA) protein
LKAGRFVLNSKMHERPGSNSAGVLVLADGERKSLGTELVSIGRLPDCGVVVADPNVSRVHAEIKPSGTGYVIQDKGSTNGTKINGVAMSVHRLADGDEITIGTARIRFEAS